MNDFEKLISSLPMSKYNQKSYQKKSYKDDISKQKTYEQLKQYLYDACSKGFKKIQNGDINLYKRFLEIYCYSKHSMNNTMLEALQFPDGHCFKSKDQWIKENLSLKPDAQSIVAWKPDNKYYDPQKKKTISVFSPTNFYDVSQVEVDEYEYLKQFQKQKFSLKELFTFALIEIKKNGLVMKVLKSENSTTLPETMVYDPKTKELVFTNGMSEDTLCYNFVREYVHFLAYKNNPNYDRFSYEFDAESITYILVKQYCGIDYETSNIDIDSRFKKETIIDFFKDKNVKETIKNILNDFNQVDKHIYELSCFEPKKEKIIKPRGMER